MLDDLTAKLASADNGDTIKIAAGTYSFTIRNDKKTNDEGGGIYVSNSSNIAVNISN